MDARRIGLLGTVLTAGALLALAGCGGGDEPVESAGPAEARTEAVGTASELAGVKRDAAARAVELFPSATLTWFEDTMHDIPLQRPVELAAELARFANAAREVPGRG